MVSAVFPMPTFLQTEILLQVLNGDEFKHLMLYVVQDMRDKAQVKSYAPAHPIGPIN